MNATNERMCNETSSSTSSSNSNSSNMKPQQQHKLQTTQLTQTTRQRIAQKLPLPLGHAQPTTPPAPMAALFPLAENPFEPHFLDTFLAATVSRQCKCMILDYLEGKIKFKLK